MHDVGSGQSVEMRHDYDGALTQVELKTIVIGEREIAQETLRGTNRLTRALAYSNVHIQRCYYKALNSIR